MKAKRCSSDYFALVLFAAAAIWSLELLAASCSFDCPITNNANKVPFYTGPYCSNDPIGWAFGRFALEPYCGMTCSMIESRCSIDGLVSGWLRRNFPDCCDDYQPVCSFCRHGLLDPTSVSLEKTLYEGKRLISTNFTASCAELEVFHDMRVSNSDSMTCDKLRHSLKNLNGESSSWVNLAGCECDPGPPTISPAPTKDPSSFPSLAPSIEVTLHGLSCSIKSEDYFNPGWYYAVAAIILIVYFIPTFAISNHLLRKFASKPQNKKKMALQILSKFWGDFCQGAFLVVNAYAFSKADTARPYCNKTTFTVNIIAASFELGMDFISDIIAIATLRNVNTNETDHIESAKWKALEYVGGWITVVFAVLAATGAVWIGVDSTMSTLVSDGSFSVLDIVVLILLGSIPLLANFIQPIYSYLYDEHFSFQEWCSANCSLNPCDGLQYACREHSWRNKEGMQPHTGPVWGGSARIFLEYSGTILMVIELLLNIESSVGTVFLLAGSLMGKIAKLLSGGFFDCGCGGNNVDVDADVAVDDA